MFSYRRCTLFSACLFLTLILVASAGALSFASLQTTGHVGVSYFTRNHFYDTSTQTLESDFARFRNDGIKTIAIVLFWYNLELSKGVYNQQFINNVIHVCNVAEKYGLEVMIDFHTIANEADAWTNPAYVGVAMRLITDKEIANAYVAMLDWALRELKDVKNIWAISVLNEPWYWPLDEWRKTNWINLMTELTNTARQITTKPVTIRFVSALFERDWNWDPRLMAALDFISLNARVIPSQTNDIYWHNFDEYRSGLLEISQKAAALGKQVEVTEFGYATYNDTLQADMYRGYTDIFDSTPNLIGWLSWGWDRSYDPNDPSSYFSDSSIFDPVTETVRPAYLYLIKSIKTGATQGEAPINAETGIVALLRIPSLQIVVILTGVLAGAGVLLFFRKRRIRTEQSSIVARS